MTWLTDVQLSSQIQEVPSTLLTAQTGTGSAPADANPPPHRFDQVGDGATILTGDTVAAAKGSIRIDGWRELSLSVELFVASGSGSVTIRPYFWDGSRWVKCGDSVIYTSSQTSSISAARERHDIIVDNDYGFAAVIEAISGTSATAAVYATRKNSILVRK